MSARLDELTPELIAEWETLAESVRASPFARPGWFEAWSLGFARRPLVAVTLRDRGRLVALLPLLQERRGLRSPTNWHSIQFGPLSADDGSARLLLQHLFTGRWPRIDLGHLAPRTADDARRAAAACGRHQVFWVQQRAPYIAIDQPWESYAERLDRRWLRQLESRRRRLARDGLLYLDVTDGASDLDRLLREGFQLEAAGWKGEGGTSILSHATTRRFYGELAAWAASRGWLRLAFLRLSGRAIAFDLCIEHDGVHYFLKTGFDPSLRASAPGLILRHDMIRRSFDLGLRRHELLGGDERWKMAWTETTREMGRLVALRASPIGQLEWAAYAHGRPLLKRAQQRWRALRG